MIANLLPEDGNHIVGGSVMVNGVDSRNKEIVWRVRLAVEIFSSHLITITHCSPCVVNFISFHKNVVAYVNQIDMLHGFLTVKETIEFAFQCSYG